MKTSQVLLVCFLSFSSVFTACGEGTLKCSSEDKPDICDFTQMYVLNEAQDGCEKKTVDGCEILNFDFTASDPCLLCEAGKVVDTVNSKCVDVAVDKQKPDCKRYLSSNSSCIECNENFFVSGGNCVGVGETKIDNCAIYTDATTCLSCAKDFYLKGTACESLKKVDNCYAHTVFQCDECESDYVINRGLNNDITVDSALKDSLARGNYLLAIMAAKNANSVCQKTDVENCVEFETFDKCKTCKALYMVTDTKKCLHYPEDTISNCSKFSDETTCVECTMATHYLATNSCQPRTDVPECETYVVGEDKCAKCKDSHYLASTGLQCTARDPTTYKNCEKSKVDDDVCEKCDAGHEHTADKKACLIIPPNCDPTSYTAATAHTDSHHPCTTCVKGYTLTTGQCGGTPVSDCKDYEANTSTCTTCDPTFYLDGTSCKTQSVNECDDSDKIANYVANENKCFKCNKLFKPNDTTGICESIGKTNCAESNGKDLICTACKAGFLLEAGDCQNTRTTAPNNCLTNVSSTDDTLCNSCTTGHFFATGQKPLISDADLATLKCLSINKANNKCNQCADRHYWATGDVCTALDAAVTDNNCIRQTVDHAHSTDLSSDQNCAVCNSARGYISDGTNCVDLPASNLINCTTLGTDGVQNCKACTNGTELMNIETMTCGVNSIGDRGKITNCQIYTKPGKCYACSNSKVPNTDKDACVDPTSSTAKVDLAFDYIGIPINMINATEVNNCVKYTQVDTVNTACIQCAQGYVGIVDVIKGAKFQNTGASNNELNKTAFGGTAFSLYKPNASTYSPFISCIAVGQGIGSTNKFTAQAADSENNCAIGVDFLNSAGDGTEGKYACIRCQEDKIGTIATLNTTVSDDNFFAAFVHISACNTYDTDGADDNDDTLDATWASHPKGFGYSERFNKNQVSWNAMLAQSKCTGPDDVPVYSMEYNTVANTLPFKYVALAKTIYCANRDTLTFYNLATTANRANCAVAIRKADETHSATFSSSSKTKVECIACKPKFEAVFGSGKINDCKPITPCTGEKWLDACSESTNTYSMGTEGNYRVVNFNNITQTNSLLQCVAQTSTKCKICKPGFQPSSSGVCTEVGANNGCSIVANKTGGLGLFVLDNVNTANHTPATVLADEIKQLISATQVRYMDENFDTTYATNQSPLCKECASGDPYYAVFDFSFGVCGKSISKDAITYTDTNCTKNDKNGGCQACADTFIPKTDTAECVAQDTHENCVAVTGSACSKCATGYILEQGVCNLTYCKVSNPDDSDKCIVCADRSRKSSMSAPITKCLAPATEDASIDCLNFDGQNGLCVKCAGSNKIPINFTYTNAENTEEKSWRCVDWTKGAAEEGYHAEYLYVTYSGTSTNGVPTFASAEINYLANTGWANREYMDFTDGDKTAARNCLPESTVPDCMDKAGSMCTKCNDGFSLNGTENKCVALTDSNCVTGSRNDKAVCTKCTDTYFVNNGVCAPRTQGQNCKNKFDDQDKCKDCVTGERYLKDATTCDLYTAENCEGYKSDKNECSGCKQGFHLVNTSGVHSCDAVTTVTGCDTYETNSDECKTCKADFYKDTTGAKLACPERTKIEFCKADQLDPNADRCLECEEGRYYNAAAKECRLYPSGKNNCEIYSFPDTCDQCDAGYFLEGGNCTKVTTVLDGCLVHKSQTACQVCESTRILNGDVCDAIVTKTGCAEYSDKDTCKKCEPRYFLESGACVDSTITGCTEPIKGTPNTCNACSPDRFLNAQKTSCTLGTAVVGCVEYKSQNECVKCSSTKILSADGTKCDPITDLAGSNCSLGTTLADPICDVCMYGFKKGADGACTAITATNCVTEDSSGKCLICKPGTYMNKDGACTEPARPECDPDTDPDCKYAAIRTAFVMMLAFFMMNLF